MPAIVLKKIQEAFIGALKSSTAIAFIVNDRVFNHVPQGTPYPYLVFHIVNLELAPPKNGEVALFATIRVDSFTEYHGDTVNLNMHDAVLAALDGETVPALDANATIDCIQFLNSSFSEGKDGMTHVASFSYSAYLTPN